MARVFDLRLMYCEACGEPLKWQRRKDMPTKLLLSHDKKEGCPHSGKKFYAAPLAYDLTEFTD